MKTCPRCAAAYPDDSEKCATDGTSLKPEVDALIGKTVAQRYRLIARLGSGPLALVYLARHVMIDRLSALKVLRPKLAGDRALVDRFLAQARAVNRINHENIVEISDFGESESWVYLVMEYVAGPTLRQDLAPGPFAWQRAASMAAQIAAALGRAHQMGVVHGSLEPRSVLLFPRRDGTEGVKLIDFGATPGAAASPSSNDSPLPYVAPECLFSGARDVRSDLYALGALLYETLSGVAPARPPGSDPLPIEKHVPRLPDGLAALVGQLLRGNPEHRPRDAFVVQDELAAALRGYARFSTRPPNLSDPSERPPLSSGPDSVARAADRQAKGPGSRRLAELEPMCREALIAIERSVAEAHVLPGEAQSALAEARALIDRIATVGEAVRRDQREISDLEQQSADLKASFGRALDELGRDASRARAAIDELRALRADLQKQPDIVERLRREQLSSEDLEYQVTELRRRLELQTEEQDVQLMRARATLDDHVVALRALATEAWDTIERAAALLGVPPSLLEQRRA